MSVLDETAIALSEGIDPNSFVIATYLLQGPAGEDMLARANAIAIEQTVGRGVFNLKGMEGLVEKHGGKLLSLIPVPDHESKPTVPEGEWQRYIARVAFPVENTGFQIPMLLTTVLGDISMGGMIKLVDLDLPGRFVKAFRGPKFGLEGIRKTLGTDRPLICSILKPCVGITAEIASDIFYQHAIGGADVIKDDELMVYWGDIKLEDRVRACVQAEKRAYEETGERTLYLASITDRPDRMVDNAKRAIDSGASGLMITPLTTGISAIQMLAEDPEIQVPIFGHPALLGATSWSPDYGISEHILVGKLFRIAGTDINAVPVPYDRFPHLREKFIKVFKISKAPMGHIKPVFTQTGGGVNPINSLNILRDVGKDVMLVAGGSVQAHPMGLSAGIRAIRQAIQTYQENIPLNEAIKKFRELGLAWDIWGQKKG